LSTDASTIQLAGTTSTVSNKGMVMIRSHYIFLLIVILALNGCAPATPAPPMVQELIFEPVSAGSWGGCQDTNLSLFAITNRAELSAYIGAQAVGPDVARGLQGIDVVANEFRYDAFTSNNVNTTLNQTGVSSYYVSGQAAPSTIIPVNRTGKY